MRRFALVLLAAGGLIIAGDSSRHKEDFQQSHPFVPGGKLTLRTFNGSVEITGWDQSTVDVSGAKYAETEEMLRELKVDVKVAGDAISIEANKPQGLRINGGVKLVVKVPRKTTLESVMTSNGSIQVNEIDANTRVTTSNGSVKAARIRGTLEATTSNGAIRAEVLERTAAPIRATTSNGSIELILSGGVGEGVRAATSNGGITVRLPAAASARLDASTSNASVETEFGIRMSGTISSRRVAGDIGSGGPLLELRTSNGGIRVLKL